jgi:hypothetical protein
MAAAVLAIGSYAWADNSSQPVSQVTVSPMTLDVTPAPAMPAPAAPASNEQPLAQMMDSAGIKLPFVIQGYVEAGYMYDTNAPRIAEGTTFNGFEGYKNRFILDQADLQILRTPVASGKNFDWGFMLEGGYGSDYTFVHSNGMMDNRAGGPPQNQSDIDQAYLSFNIPAMNGIILNAGKFVTPLGYETINPTTNPLYSHSYAFLYAIPFTQTGITAKTALNSQWTAMAGITRGWDQSLKDSNGDPDFIGQVVFTPNSTWSFTGNLSEGPQAPHGVGRGVQALKGDDSHWWTVIDLDASYTMSDQLSFGAGADYGDAPRSKPHFGPTSNAAAQWYGITGYAKYVLIKDTLTANGRLEWYDDTDGFTLAGVHASVYSATVGVTYVPVPGDKYLKWLEIRPEIRYDYATKPIFDTGEGPGQHGQLNLAADVIMQY